MKKIVLLFAAALGLVACGAPEKQAVVERNANTQNPIMPILFPIT